MVRQLQRYLLTPALAFLLLSLTCAAEPWSLSQGDLPLLIVSVHGGTEDLPDAEPRTSATSLDPRFNPRRDVNTSEMARTLQEKVAASNPEGRMPSLLVSHVHRRFADLNRPLELAATLAPGREFHQDFHRHLEVELERLRKEHGWVLLLDIHGQASYPVDLMLGTAHQESVSDWSVQALWGADGWLATLTEAGFSAEPETPEDQQRFSGGYITTHYGAQPWVEAWQFEHGKDLRFDLERREQYLDLLAQFLVSKLSQKLKNQSWPKD